MLVIKTFKKDNKFKIANWDSTTNIILTLAENETKAAIISSASIKILLDNGKGNIASIDAILSDIFGTVVFSIPSEYYQDKITIGSYSGKVLVNDQETSGTFTLEVLASIPSIPSSTGGNNN